jgi:hypothetical protein
LEAVLICSHAPSCGRGNRQDLQREVDMLRSDRRKLHRRNVEVRGRGVLEVLQCAVGPILG